MINTDIEQEIFKVFTTKQCPDVDMYNSLCSVVTSIMREEIGKADAMLYNRIADIYSSENNANWEGRHTKRISELGVLMDIIEERSGDYLL